MTLIALWLAIYSFLLHGVVDSYKILGVFPHHGWSHFLMFEPLLLELANRGHEVVVISRFPQKVKVPNYTDIDVRSDRFHDSTSSMPLTMFDTLPVSTYVDITALYNFFLETENILKHPKVQKTLNSERHQFDLLITETFNSRLFFGFAHKLRIPMITLSSCALFPWAAYDVGAPVNPAYIPFVLGDVSNRMNFWERLTNTVKVSAMTLAFEYLFETKGQEIARKYFGEDVPPLNEIAKNTSLTLVNSHFSYHGSRPLVPAVVEIGGISLKQPKPIPQDIEKFINESEHGVVYFCMGSLLQGSSFPPEKRDAFLKAFSRIKQRVLWKWEGELPGKSDNIMTAKWMPQRDILAHKNVKLFISHGGLLGTSEAVYEAVPIIGIPIFGDQRTNVRSIEAAGAGELLDYNEISEDVVYEKIQKVLNNPSYRENAKELSRRYKDRPMSPMDTAVYWTEYVIRHKGAYHLRSAAVDLSWYQYLLLDVIAVVLLAAVIVIVALYLTVKFILKSIARILGLSSKPVIKKAKVN